MSKVDLSLGRALSNPFRIKIICALEEGKASPRQLAEILDEDLARISYHLAILAKSRCVRVDEAKQRRGVVEHIYELTPVPGSRRVNRSFRGNHNHASALLLRAVMEEGAAALRASTQGDDGDEGSYLGHMPAILSAQDASEIAEVIEEVMDRLKEIQAVGDPPSEDTDKEETQDP